MISIAPASVITGWMSEPELYWLAVRASNHDNIIEAGCYYGRSTRALCDNARGIVNAVDPWNGNYGKNLSKDGTPTAYQMVGSNIIFNHFLVNLSEHLHSGKCRIHIMEFHKTDIKDPDMIFIDAIHDYEDVVRDIEHAMKLMKKGLLCGHDYSSEWPGVVKAVDDFFPKHEVIDTIWYTTL